MLQASNVANQRVEKRIKGIKTAFNTPARSIHIETVPHPNANLRDLHSKYRQNTVGIPLNAVEMTLLTTPLGISIRPSEPPYPF